MSIDWVSIYQQHDPSDVPEWGAGWVLSLDSEGQAEWETLRTAQQRGSYDSSVHVRCYAGVVEWRGNPSRWNRPDNLWGFPSLWDALRLINRHLASLGLPRFTTGHRVRNLNPKRDDPGYGERGQMDTAILTRVDVARVYSAGRDKNAVLRALQQQVWHGKQAQRFDPYSLAWGSRQHTRVKWYDKAREMLAHKLPKDASDEWREYRERLVNYAEQEGLLRFELELGRNTLRRLGLRALRDWDDGKVWDMVKNTQHKMMPEVGTGGLGDIAEVLRSYGYSAKQARAAENIAHKWAAGNDVFSELEQDQTRHTAYRYRRMLRSVGIDIRQSLQDVTSLRVQPRVADVRPVGPPGWYQMPSEYLASVAS